jgi:hypothetical protein
MKTRHPYSIFISSLVLAASGTVSAQTAPSAPAAQRELTVEVVESLEHGPGRVPDFDRINSVFTDVFQKREWPVKIKVERFAANTSPHETELRIFYQGIFEETPGDRTFRAWMILYDHGTKHDLGFVHYTYYSRPLQNVEDVLEHAVRGAAEEAATKIESVLPLKEGGPRP